MAEERQRDDRGRFSRGDEPPADVAEADEGDRPDAGHHVEDISDTPAPSVGPHTTFEKPPPPTERSAATRASDVDAMGLDKRRQVTGGSYGPSFARQATLYGAFVAIVIALAFGFKLLADELDQPPETNPAQAPWTGNDRPPRPLQ